MGSELIFGCLNYTNFDLSVAVIRSCPRTDCVSHAQPPEGCHACVLGFDYKLEPYRSAKFQGGGFYCACSYGVVLNA